MTKRAFHFLLSCKENGLFHLLPPNSGTMLRFSWCSNVDIWNLVTALMKMFYRFLFFFPSLLETYQTHSPPQRLYVCRNQTFNACSINTPLRTGKWTSNLCNDVFVFLGSSDFSLEPWLVAQSRPCCLFCHVWWWLPLTAVCLWATLIQTSWRPH